MTQAGKDPSSTDPKDTRAKVDRETAENEVNRFLDAKHVSAKKREGQNSSHIENIIQFVMDGVVTFDFPAKRMKYNLMFPLSPKSGDKIDSLSMRFFMGAQESTRVLNNIDVEDVYARSLALAAALSENNVDILKAAENASGEKGMDLSDQNTIISYTAFFLG